MTFKEFEKFAQNHNVVPVFERVTADLLTPVLAYLKIRNTGSNHFLLESVEGIGRLARYSFIGKNPRKVFYNRDKNLTIVENGQNDLPDFSGGIVGYLGYENIGLIENVIKFTDNCQLDTPDSFFGIYNTLIIFDHYKHQLIILTNVLIDKNKGLRTLYDEAKEKLKKIREEIDGPVEF
ncbi:MAG: anthranilate synthase component I, partial [Ignavibacteriaceae bacterium]